MVRPLAHPGPFAPFAEPVRRRPVSSVDVDALDDLQDIRDCLQELVTAQRRVLDEVRRRAAVRDVGGRYDQVIAGLTRATASLLQGIEPAATNLETICWECNRPIVAGRLAQAADVKRHMLTCEPRID